MNHNVHLRKFIPTYTIPSGSLRKEPLARRCSRVITSLSISLDFIHQKKSILLLKRISKVHHLTIRSHVQIPQLKRYFLKRSSYLLRITGLHCPSVTLEVPSSINTAYRELSKLFKGCTYFKIYQYDPIHMYSGSIERYGTQSHTQKVVLDLILLRMKLQADALRILPMFQDIIYLELFLDFTYENLPSSDSNILKATLGRLTKLRTLTLQNTATSQIQTGVQLNDITLTLDSLKALEKLSLKANVLDSETNVLRKMVTVIQNMKKLEDLDLHLHLLNAQFYNKTTSVNKCDLMNLKKLSASALSLPEERLAIAVMSNFRSLVELDLSAIITSRDNYRGLLANIKNNGRLETLSLVLKFTAVFPAIEELAEIIQSNKQLRRLAIDLQGKPYPPERGLKKLLNEMARLEDLVSFGFESSREFQISGRGLEEIFGQMRGLKKLEDLKFSCRALDKIEEKGMICTAIDGLVSLKRCFIEVKGMKFGQEFDDVLERVKGKHCTLVDVLVVTG